jgi:hypothetical protein
MTRLNWFVVFASLFYAQRVYSAAPVEPNRSAGEALAADLRNQKPSENTEVTGILKMRDAQGKRTESVLRFRTVLGGKSWDAIYEVQPTSERVAEKLIVVHEETGPNRYSLAQAKSKDAALPDPAVCVQLMAPFARSDLWIADLGLEFFHWPAQRLTTNEMRRGRACKVLESLNPQPAPGAYARVLSWVDAETDGLLRAEAYDSSNKLWKEFSVGSFKKIKGRWELQDIEIRNLRTDSRTRLEFDLDN